nr:MAG TPA: putative YqgC-like protein [Caudoviricetes sp.]
MTRNVGRYGVKSAGITVRDSTCGQRVCNLFKRR